MGIPVGILWTSGDAYPTTARGSHPGRIHAPRELGSCQREPCRCGRRARFHVRGQAPSRRLYQRFDPSTAIQVEVACNRWPRIACLRTALGEQRTDVTFLESRNSPFWEAALQVVVPRWLMFSADSRHWAYNFANALSASRSYSRCFSAMYFSQRVTSQTSK